jgi:hypothetical protein
MCEIRGDSVILTPQSSRGSKEYITDPVSGLRVSKRKPRADKVSSDMVRKLLEESSGPPICLPTSRGLSR